MKSNLLKPLMIFLFTALLSTQSFAQDSFYQGKTVRIIVGASAGGGYDTYSRTIARHMGKYIPGNPTFVVENMPGAGFLISGDLHIQSRQTGRADNWTLHRRPFLQQLLEKPGVKLMRESSNMSAFQPRTIILWESPKRPD